MEIYLQLEITVRWLGELPKCGSYIDEVTRNPENRAETRKYVGTGYLYFDSIEKSCDGNRRRYQIQFCDL